MPIDHLIKFNDLKPNRLELELIKTSKLPLMPPGFEKMRHDLEHAGASAAKLIEPNRSKASDQKRV
jgi:hypothetical protein